MTQVRMLVDVAYTAGLLNGGTVYDLPPGEAEALVIVGWAEELPEEYEGTTMTVTRDSGMARTLLYGRGEVL